ncbi:hypothetical protein [Streptomyces sp. NPDC055005]
MLLAAAWRACDLGVNGAANEPALIFYGVLLTVMATAWWGALIGYAGRWNLTVVLLDGVAGAAVMVRIFVALLQVPNGYR